jgi:hypothetical protein
MKEIDQRFQKFPMEPLVPFFLMKNRDLLGLLKKQENLWGLRETF